MIQPHSGSGKGFYFIPEIDEEVLVGFEGSNAQNPYVLGAQYSGSATSGYADAQNNVKVIHTRSGHILKFTEDESIIITDKTGNEIQLDTVGGNINITAPKTITMNASNIIMNASENITTTAGINITESAGVDKSTNVVGILNTRVGLDKILYVGGNHNINIDGDLNSETAKDHNLTSGSKIISQTENSHEIHSQKEIKNNSSEKTKQN